MKSENHETCQDVKISYVKVVIKIEEVSRKLSRTMLANRSRPLHDRKFVVMFCEQDVRN